MKLVVIYHGNCMDGFGAACAHYSNTNLNTDDIKYVPASYPMVNKFKEFSSEVLEGCKRVMFLDICPSIETLDHLTEELGVDVVILDHHKTGRDILTTYPNVSDKVRWAIGKNYSGATLTHFCAGNIDLMFEVPTYDVKEFDEFLGNFNVPEYISRKLQPLNKIYNLLEVRDLWITEDPKRKYEADCFAECCRFNDVSNGKVGDINEIVSALGGVESMIATGASIKMVNSHHIDLALSKSYTNMIITNDGDTIEYCIGVCPPGIESDYGDAFKKSCGDSKVLAVAIQINAASGNLGLSLRSSGSIPLARLVATEFGGGGHDHASGAGFSPDAAAISIPELIKLIEAALGKIISKQ